MGIDSCLIILPSFHRVVTVFKIVVTEVPPFGVVVLYDVVLNLKQFVSAVSVIVQYFARTITVLK